MLHVSGINRNQVQMSSLEDMVDKASSARFIDKFVDAFDCSYFVNATTNSTGRPSYSPKDMLKLYIYGMENGIISSRKLERECERNVELMWLLNNLRPESKTICNFRRNNKENMVKYFQEFCVNLVKSGLVDGKLMAIDGTKIRANNSKRNNFSVKKIDKRIEYIDDKIKTYLNDTENADKLEELNQRKETYGLMKQKMQTENISEISTVDPDARLMSANNNGVDVAYNVQSVVDSQHKLIAGMAVTTNAADAGQLGEVMPKVKRELGLTELTVTGDKGYYKTEDFHTCEENNITTIVAKNNKTVRDTYDIDSFIYNSETNTYKCPGGSELFPGKTNAKGYAEYKNKRACDRCPHKEACTKGSRRVINRHMHKASAELNDERYRTNLEIYRQRQTLVEHPFGTIKRTMGIRQFLTRGLKSVAAEVALIFLCYDLKRLRNLGYKVNPNPTLFLTIKALLQKIFPISNIHPNIFAIN